MIDQFSCVCNVIRELDFNYSCIFMCASGRFTDVEFKKKFTSYLRYLHNKYGIYHIGMFHHSDFNRVYHFHGSFYIPDPSDELIERIKNHCNKRFGFVKLKEIKNDV